MVVFGRGVVELINGSISVRTGSDSSFQLAHRSENLAVLAENFVLNMTANGGSKGNLLAAVTYV